MALKGTLTGTYNATVTLTSAGYTNPVTVAGTATIDATIGNALFGQAPTAWTVVNQGLIETSATAGNGVQLAAGGSIDNAAGARISGGNDGIYATTAATTITTAGTIVGTARDGINLAAGGSVSIASTGSAGGAAAGIAISGGAGTVTNQGVLNATGTTGAGVSLGSGGSVVNAAGASIGTGFGIYISGGTGSVDNAGTIAGTSQIGVVLNAGGALTNETTGTITGHYAAVRAQGGLGTLVDFGSIAGTAGSGADFNNGGSVSIGTAGAVSGVDAAVAILGAAGTVHNAGLVRASTASGRGVALFAGGSVSNQASAAITGYVGIYAATSSTAAAVVNAGSIAGSGNFGVELNTGGSVTNAAGGTIASGEFGVVIAGAVGTVENAGSIGAVGAGDAVRFAAGGNVTNTTGGVISGTSHGVAIQNGIGTVTNAGSITSTESTHGAVALDAGGMLVNSAGGFISGDYGVYTLGGGTVINAGTIASAGTSTAIDMVDGQPNRLIVDPGAVFIGVVQGGNTMGATAVSVLELAPGTGALTGIGTSFTNFGSITFDAGADWMISGSTAALAGGQTITGFGVGDTIELDGVATSKSAFANGTLALADGLKLLLPGTSYTFSQFQVTNPGGNTDITVVACFGAGTRVLTDAGEVAVEALRPGMRVVSLTHRRPIAVRWVGWQRIACAQQPAAWPVRISVGAFGAGVPHRSLHLSPDHAVFLDGVLMPVRHLINGASIAQIACNEINYFHVEMEAHGVLLAEGLPAESYLDTGNRLAFVDGGEANQCRETGAVRRTEGR